jgi:hypothetical protein
VLVTRKNGFVQPLEPLQQTACAGQGSVPMDQHAIGIEQQGIITDDQFVDGDDGNGGFH